ncbi:MAG: HypC/HybG/HupF family hydrogenase formation chaperone [Bacillota bacterium]
MCLAIPGKVMNIMGNRAEVSIMGAAKEVSIVLIESLNIGDYVIVHAACAISKIDEIEALKTIEIFRELGEECHE